MRLDHYAICFRTTPSLEILVLIRMNAAFMFYLCTLVSTALNTTPAAVRLGASSGPGGQEAQQKRFEHVCGERLAGNPDGFGLRQYRHGRTPKARNMTDRHPGGDDIDRGGRDFAGVLCHGGDAGAHAGVSAGDNLDDYTGAPDGQCSGNILQRQNPALADDSVILAWPGWPSFLPRRGWGGEGDPR